MTTIKQSLRVALAIIKCTPSKEYQAHRATNARINRRITALEFKTKPVEASHT